MLHHIKKDLFSVKAPAILVHAVNCKGVMAHGIAKEFKRRFPLAVKRYELDCQALGKKLLGKSAIYTTGTDDYIMGCLFTSAGYGRGKDCPESILAATDRALRHFTEFVEAIRWSRVFSNKFNSGLFAVPWHRTEQVLSKHVGNFGGIDWTVCTPPGEEVKP